MDKTKDSKIILGMVLLQDAGTFDIDTLRKDFKNNFSDDIQQPAGDNSSLAFTVEGELIIIAYMPLPIPPDDIESTARYAYNWLTALEDTKDHKSHLTVSLIQGSQDQIKRFKIFTKVICSLLRTTQAIGVYIGDQSLLIPKQEYLNEAGLMTDNYLPLNLWIYFGLRTASKGMSGYTYGLKKFDKMEIEVLNSSKRLDDIRGLLFNITHYVLANDVTLQDGQTCGLSKEEKIPISISKAKFVDGNSLKLAY